MNCKHCIRERENHKTSGKMEMPQNQKLKKAVVRREQQTAKYLAKNLQCSMDHRVVFSRKNILLIIYTQYTHRKSTTN